MKESVLVVGNAGEMENAVLAEVAVGFDIVMQTDTQTVLKRRKRRSWLWLLVFWPMLLIKKEEIKTVAITKGGA